jgi:hypothetical protein
MHLPVLRISDLSWLWLKMLTLPARQRSLGSAPAR